MAHAPFEISYTLTIARKDLENKPPYSFLNSYNTCNHSKILLCTYITETLKKQLWNLLALQVILLLVA